MAARNLKKRIRRRRRARRGARPNLRDRSVFLNIPYDSGFENLFLAYIAGISAFGFAPRATLEIPFGERRLNRILSLIQESKYSVHDLSRVQVERKAPRAPRFNMPFELGLTVAIEKSSYPDHAWVVCETVAHRIKKSLSDLDGTDAYIHNGTIAGVFRELRNAFVGSRRQPTVKQMAKIYKVLRTEFNNVLQRTGAGICGSHRQIGPEPSSIVRMSARFTGSNSVPRHLRTRPNTATGCKRLWAANCGV
jgi:hypothetical protein